MQPNGIQEVVSSILIGSTKSNFRYGNNVSGKSR